MAATVFNDMEIDAIGEIMNISIGASATAVSTMLGTATNITTPVVSVETRSQFEFHDLEPAVGVEISYVEGLNGRNIMMFSRDDVRVIVGMMMGMEIPPEDFVMDEMNASAIREVMNQMMGSSATALSEFLGYPVNISTPVSFEIPDEKTFKEKYFPRGVKQVVVRFKLEIGDRLSTEFLNIMSISLAKKLLEPYASSLGSAAADESEEAVEEEGKEESGEEGVSKNGDDGAHADDMAADTEPASADSGGKPLDQAATDALLARLKGDVNESADTKDSEQEPDDADVEEQYRKIRSSNSGNRTLSQSEMDELMKKISGEGQRADEAAETKLRSGGGRASEAENARNTQPQPQVQAQPQVQVQTGADAGVQAPAQSQVPAQSQALAQSQVPAQPQVQTQPQASASDPVLASILASMQQSQTAMMELIREMHEENKAAEAFRRKEYEAKESAGSDGRNGGAERSGVHKDRIRSLNSPEFSDLAKDGVEQEENREMLMRVPLEISVEVGRTRKPVKDILDLTQGSLVVLDKMAGEQADLYVNGECIARGDIVVVEDNFGIRITEILNKDITRETVK